MKTTKLKVQLQDRYFYSIKIAMIKHIIINNHTYTTHAQGGEKKEKNHIFENKLLHIAYI